MTVPTPVDRSALVIALHEIDIEAPLDTVLRTLLDASLVAWLGHLNTAAESPA